MSQPTSKKATLALIQETKLQIEERRAAYRTAPDSFGRNLVRGQIQAREAILRDLDARLYALKNKPVQPAQTTTHLPL